MDTRRHFVAMQGRGLLAIPAVLRRRYRLDEPGAQVEIIERADGVLELRPHLPVPADQAWFWSERWQRMEREVDDHVAQGEVSTFDTPDAMFEHLDREPNAP